MLRNIFQGLFLNLKTLNYLFIGAYHNIQQETCQILPAPKPWYTGIDNASSNSVVECRELLIMNIEHVIVIISKTPNSVLLRIPSFPRFRKLSCKEL